MRITDSMIVSKFLSDANSSLSRVSKYQDQVVSTKRISRISDDPMATISALKARNRLSNLSLYQSNIMASSSYLKEADSAASGLDEIFQTAYEEMVSASSGSKTQEELDVIAQEFVNLKKEVVSIANTSMGSSYIFGGNNVTGSSNGISKTAPFSVDETTGDLKYNGINLSKFSWKGEFENSTGLIQGFSNTILDASTELSSTSSDYYARNTVCENAKNALSDLLACGKSALKSAQEFDSGTDLSALSGKVDALSSIYDSFYNEVSKELAGDHIIDTDPAIELNGDGTINTEYYKEKGITVMTQDELDNQRFSKAKAQGFLDQATAIVKEQYDGLGNPIGSQLKQAVAAVTTQMDIDPDVEQALKDETENGAKLQIGLEQTIDYTVTGIDLMGSGKDNIYHILDKCSKILSGELSQDQLGSMVTELQNAQQNILNLQAKVGSTQNRLNLISNRYTTSEINYEKMKSEAEDVDMAEAITNLNTAKTVYSASLAAGAKIMQISLIDFLR